MEGEKYHDCKTCLDRWNVTYTYCNECLSVAQAEHGLGHQFNSYTFRETKQLDEQHRHVQCQDCSLSLCTIIASVPNTG